MLQICTLWALNNSSKNGRVGQRRRGWQEAPGTEKEGAVIDGTVCPQQALPFLQGRPMAVLSALNLFLVTAGVTGRLLFPSLLCSLSTSPVLCSFAPKYTSGDRNISFTLQVALQ